MRVRNSIVLALGGFLAMSALICQAAQIPGNPPRTALEIAAQSAYQATYATYLADRAEVEGIYRWSRRVKEAELAAGKGKAAEDHLQRMQQLHQRVAALFKAGAAGASAIDLHATEYYVAKAKLAAENAKAAK